MKKFVYLTVLFCLGIIVPTQSRNVSPLKQTPTNKEKNQLTTTSNDIIYVSAKGSNRNDGKSKDKPIKDLQKAIDNAPEGATLHIAEGNYLGTLDVGFVKVNKYISLIGGYSEDFSKRDPLRYRSTIRPTSEQAIAGTAGNHGLLDIYVSGKRKGVILVDGIIFDRGQFNTYAIADPKNERTGTPEGCETGQAVVPGGSATFPVNHKGGASAFQLIHGDVEGQVTIRNCVFLNGLHFAIQMGNKGGHFDIYNNVFVSNRMAACEVRGMLRDPGHTTVAFHNNTVMFSWCRTKIMDDMGYSFRYMTGIDADVYNNIFAFSNFPALDRTYIDADKKKESVRKTSAWDNLFFANKADINLPSGGGKWLMRFAKDFEDVPQLEKYEGNREMNKEEIKKFTAKVDAAYLKGFMSLTTSTTESYDPNSSANQTRELLGMNKQGTSTTRVSMYANRYPYEKAFDLFGAIEKYGAQKIK